MGVKMPRVLGEALRLKTIEGDYLTHSELHKNVGLLDLLGLALSLSVAFGAYVLNPSACRDLSGPSTTIAVLIAFIAMIITGLHYCEISLKFPKSGSLYVACYAVFGELFAFLFGWMMVVDYAVAIAYVTREWSAHMQYLFNNSLRSTVNVTSLQDQPFDFIGLIGLSASCLLFLCSMKVIGVVALVFGVVSTLIISSSILVGFFYSQSSNWVNAGFFPNGATGIIQAVGKIVYSFINFEVFACVAEESSSLGRSYPILIPVGVVVTFVYMFFLAAIATLTVPFTMISRDVPLPVLFGVISVPASRYVLSVGSVCGLTGTLVVLQVPAARILYAMADDGLVPAFFRKTIYRSGMPMLGTLFVDVVAGCITMMPTPWFNDLLRVTFPLRCVICILACIMLRYANYTGNAVCESHSQMFYKHLDKRRDRMYSYTFVNSNGSIVSATAPLPSDSNFSLSDSITSDFIASNVASLSLRHEATPPMVEEQPGPSGEKSTLLTKDTIAMQPLPRTTANSDAAAPKATEDDLPATPAEAPITASSLAVNAGHDCAASPCSPFSDDFRAHHYEREIPDVPFYHAFDGQNNPAKADSYVSLPGSAIRSAHAWLLIHVVFVIALVQLCLHGSANIWSSEWWSICSLVGLLIGMITTGIYFCKLPKIIVDFPKQAPGVPALSLFAVWILIAAVFSAPLISLGEVALLLLFGTILYCMYSRTRSNERKLTEAAQVPVQFSTEHDLVVANPGSNL